MTGFDVPDENPGLLNFHLLLRSRSLHAPADFNGSGGNHALNHGAFPDDHRTTCVDFAFDAAIDTDGAVKGDDALKLVPFPEKGNLSDSATDCFWSHPTSASSFTHPTTVTARGAD